MKIYSKKRLREFATGELGVLYGCTLVSDEYRFHPSNPKRVFNKRKKLARSRTGRS